MVLNSCSRPAAAQTELFTIHNGISVDFTVTLRTDLHTKMLTVTQWHETTHSRACDNVDWSFGVHVRLFSAAIEYLQGAKHNKFGTLVYNRGMQGWRMGWSKNAPADLITIHRPQPLIRVLMCPQLHIHSCGGEKKNPFIDEKHTQTAQWCNWKFLRTCAYLICRFLNKQQNLTIRETKPDSDSSQIK